MTGWLDAGEHVPPLAGWRIRRTFDHGYEVAEPSGALHVVRGDGHEWRRALGPKAHLASVLRLVVEVEEDRQAAETAAAEEDRRAARARSLAAYNALREAHEKKHAPKVEGTL